MAVPCMVAWAQACVLLRTELRVRHTGSSCPTRYHVARKLEEVQHTPGALIHHVVDAVRMLIARRVGGA